jgi:hypothetical protein
MEFHWMIENQLLPKSELAQPEHLLKFKEWMGNEHFALYGGKNWGPYFGGGSDLGIYSDCDKNTSSYSYLGNTYKPPHNYAYDSQQAQESLTESSQF